MGIFFSGALHQARAGWVTGCMAAACYCLLYWLVLSADYALLCGTLALFSLLASIMIATRKLDWYSITARIT